MDHHLLELLSSKYSTLFSHKSQKVFLQSKRSCDHKHVATQHANAHYTVTKDSRAVHMFGCESLTNTAYTIQKTIENMIMKRSIET